MGAFLGAMVSAAASARAGRAKEAAYKRDAEREEFAAKDREIQRKQRLLAAMATQNAVRGAQGIRAFEGSSKHMMEQDVETFEYDQSMGAANLAMKKQSLLESGKAARQYGYASAASTLLQSWDRQTKRG
ncbi:uncharacterized protein METZ01_LOCUS93347 [marine metagenome]|uniref:Uncharacterized protein n=1 Tax=marine metagenome TaxID=408172 RepID=A0A381VM09_9ZZZZ